MTKQDGHRVQASIGSEGAEKEACRLGPRCPAIVGSTAFGERDIVIYYIYVCVVWCTLPPLDLGTTWSRVRSLERICTAQYWQRYWSRMKMLRRFSAGVLVCMHALWIDTLSRTLHFIPPMTPSPGLRGPSSTHLLVALDVSFEAYDGGQLHLGPCGLDVGLVVLQYDDAIEEDGLHRVLPPHNHSTQHQW